MSRYMVSPRSGDSVRICQMGRLNLHEGHAPDLTTQVADRGSEREQSLSKGQKADKADSFRVSSLLQASVSLGEKGSLDVVTSKVVSRSDLGWSCLGHPTGV